ncbi:unnamed protein product [Lota lota]
MKGMASPRPPLAKSLDGGPGPRGLWEGVQRWAASARGAGSPGWASAAVILVCRYAGPGPVRGPLAHGPGPPALICCGHFFEASRHKNPKKSQSQLTSHNALLCCRVSGKLGSGRFPLG